MPNKEKYIASYILARLQQSVDRISYASNSGDSEHTLKIATEELLLIEDLKEEAHAAWKQIEEEFRFSSRK